MSHRNSSPDKGKRRDRNVGATSGDVELDAAREGDLWKTVRKRSEAVRTLTQAKLTCVAGYSKSVDIAPLTPIEFDGLIGEALGRAIERPSVVESLGSGLATETHQALRICAAQALQSAKDQARKDAPDPTEWIEAKLHRDYFDQALKTPCDGEDALWRAIQDGRNASNLLATHYARLAMHLALRKRHQGVPLEELQSAAMEGLAEAIATFDLEKGTLFRTFAIPVITNRILTAFREVPATGSHHTRQAGRFEDRRQQLSASLGRPPSDAEVYQALGWGALEVENFEKGRRLLTAKSIDAESPQDRDSIAQCRGPSPLDKLLLRENHERLYEALRRLDTTSQLVIRRRYLGDEPISQRAVGEEIGLTRDQVRTIEDNALTVMRHDMEQSERPPTHAERPR